MLTQFVEVNFSQCKFVVGMPCNLEKLSETHLTNKDCRQIVNIDSYVLGKYQPPPLLWFDLRIGMADNCNKYCFYINLLVDMSC